MALENDLIIRAAKGQKLERVPVWVMRQAGRILDEYKAIRNRLSGFIELVKTPQLAAEVTIQPVDILGVDAAIIFSDILVVPEAMGLPYTMEEGRGPAFERVVRSAKDIEQLRIADENGLHYVYEAIKETKKGLADRVPLIGFAGAPWTIMSYMVEGHGSKTFSKARGLLYTDAELAHKLLDMIAQSTIHYLKGQIRAGVDMVQIFDSWAGILPEEQYREFSLKYIKRICMEIHDVPIIVFAKGANASRREMSMIPCDVVGLDWNMSIKESRAFLGPAKTLQGNLDPAVLYGSFDTVREETRHMLDEFGFKRHIANLGHGVYPDTDADKVKCFIDTVKEYSTEKLTK
jgi:uroporphyrinogen decarboxylase